MADVTPFPFATVDELRARWPDMPAGSDDHALVLLEDASQFILDAVPSAGGASPSTRRRVVCAVVRRVMQSADADTGGFESVQVGTGPFQYGGKLNDADFYLKKAEKAALGGGIQKAFGVQVAGFNFAAHLPWCSINFGATYCSCGVDIAGVPIFEGGSL